MLHMQIDIHSENSQALYLAKARRALIWATKDWLQSTSGGWFDNRYLFSCYQFSQLRHVWILNKFDIFFAVEILSLGD